MPITAKDYAALVRCSPAMVTQKLKGMRRISLPGAAYVEKLGNTWMITLIPKFDAAEAEKEFKKDWRSDKK